MADEYYTDEALRALYQRREQIFAQNSSAQKLHAALFEPYDVSFSEYRVLATLYFHDDCEPSVMADRLMILRQTMTKVIDSLEEKGLVIRTVHPSDRRKLYINLLPEGRRVARALLCTESEYLDRVDKRLPQEELDTYVRLSAKVRDIRAEVIQEILRERKADCSGRKDA